MNASTTPRVAIVTGAGSGIGKAVAQALLHDGWHVVLAGRRAEPLQAVAQASGADARALAVPTDVLMAADDPVIPLDDFHHIAVFPNVHLELTAHGGHCGFIENALLDGYAERWVVERLASAV